MNTPKTAEEILEEVITTSWPSCKKGRAFQDLWMLFDPSSAQTQVLKAMLEYAAQQSREKSIGFAEWIENKTGDEQLALIDNNWYWESDKDGDHALSATELYDLFLIEQAKNKTP